MKRDPEKGSFDKKDVKILNNFSLQAPTHQLVKKTL
jgi:hypothetical protein